MKAYERKIVARLLRMAADEFGNHGCSDFNLADEGLTETQISQLLFKMDEANGTDPNDRQTGPYTYDWWLMSYFADRIEEGS